MIDKHFRFAGSDGPRGFAMVLRAERVSLSLFGRDGITITQAMSATEARCVANALYEAADAAENVLQAGKAPRRPNVSCSSCGRTFGPGEHGYSRCEGHAHLIGRD